MAMVCAECKFYVPPKGQDPGCCFRFPPTMQMTPDGRAWASQFTIIGKPQTMWCGEFKQNLVLTSTMPPESVDGIANMGLKKN